VARGPGLPRAFDDIQRIVAADPGYPFAHGALATMSYQYGSFAVAAQAFARVLELEPERPGVRQNYGKLLRELGRLADSERELRIALAQTPEDDSRTEISLSETLIALNKSREAESLITAVLAREPTNPEALGAKGRLLLAEGRPLDALPFLVRATATSEPDTFIELARVYLATGQLPKALESANEALRRVSGHPWALAVLGRALVLDGQRSIGLQYLQRALDAGPRRPVVWESLAEGFEAAGNRTLAAECRRKGGAATGSHG
jgi:predicted Zn-dependent protease